MQKRATGVKKKKENLFSWTFSKKKHFKIVSISIAATKGTKKLKIKNFNKILLLAFFRQIYINACYYNPKCIIFSIFFQTYLKNYKANKKK